MTVALVNTRTRKQWANEINLTWFKSVDDVCNVAELCATARSQLGPAEYQKMCEEDLSFNARLAQKFNQLGGRPDILGYARSRRLPKGYTSILDFLRLDIPTLEYAVESGLITPQMSRRKAGALIKATSAVDGEIVGDGKTKTFLPSKEEANEIARATGTAVAARDGNIYTGTTEAEQDQYNERRDQFYQTLDAINFLAELKTVDPAFFLENSEEWWTGQLSPSEIDDARGWLASLKHELETRR